MSEKKKRQVRDNELSNIILLSVLKNYIFFLMLTNMNNFQKINKLFLSYIDYITNLKKVGQGIIQ